VFVEVKYFLSRSIPAARVGRPGERSVGGNGARSDVGFTRGRESFAKTFPLINLVYRWAGAGDACASVRSRAPRSRQNLKYGRNSCEIHVGPAATSGYVPRSRCRSPIIGEKRASTSASERGSNDFRKHVVQVTTNHDGRYASVDVNETNVSACRRVESRQ